MNASDSNKLSYILSTTYGGLKVNNILDADVVILNTCSVRAQAEQKAFSYLGRLEWTKQHKNPNIKIVVIGCMTERLGVKISHRFKNVDLLVGTEDIDNIIIKIVDLCNINITAKKIRFNSQSDIVKYVTIMRGCDNYCSYCIVPFVRGREISLASKAIINECSLMVKNGTREIMLLGQNVNSYRYDGLNFASLVKKISAINGLYRIRFMTNHPKDLSDALIDIMANDQKICSHIHLPIQSASNKILTAMNRKYTYEYYFELIQKLRTAIPNISVTTDIIVGFPGETERDFEETLNAIKTIKFSGLYVFRYSQRPNTKAAEIVDDVSLKEKKRRQRVILDNSNKLSIEIVAKMVGSIQQVLVERIKNGVIEGRTRCAHKVFATGGIEKDLGKHVNINITHSRINSLFGNVI
jgi:tRNA-2-methylthio-N6-dimethylallyladenosine synthase